MNDTWLCISDRAICFFLLHTWNHLVSATVSSILWSRGNEKEGDTPNNWHGALYCSSSFFSCQPCAEKIRPRVFLWTRRKGSEQGIRLKSVKQEKREFVAHNRKGVGFPIKSMVKGVLNESQILLGKVHLCRRWLFTSSRSRTGSAPFCPCFLCLIWSPGCKDFEDVGLFLLLHFKVPYLYWWYKCSRCVYIFECSYANFVRGCACMCECGTVWDKSA